MGYIQQNNLYEFLSSIDSIEDWTLPHPMSPKLRETLLAVCYKLNEFYIFTPKENDSIDFVCLIARKWVRGDSLKEIITDQIKFNEERNISGSTNSAIRKIMKTINTDVMFRLANALRCYQLLLNNVRADRGLELSKSNFHAFLEIGANKDRVVSLINLGASREAAIEIDELLEPSIEIKTSADLIGLLNSNALDRIHTVTRRELIGLLKH